jgi:hypothetical protein
MFDPCDWRIRRLARWNFRGTPTVNPENAGYTRGIPDNACYFRLACSLRESVAVFA